MSDGEFPYASGRSGTPDDEFDAPAIRLLDDVHALAVARGASDVHIEPFAGGGRIRQRIDGRLHEIRTLSAALYQQAVSRIKLLAGMDIGDKRQPQDGGYDVDVRGRSVDVRASSMPTVNGEKIVLRLLDMRGRIPSLESLGLARADLDRYRAMLHAPYGFVVVCGPTGSGKTTTLYASIAERNVGDQHVCTVEDPVESRIPGVAQVQVNVRAGLTFSAALRSFLRQDPNVLMIGEMRDAETAQVAMAAALSGQLVLASLHAGSALRAIDRLRELGASSQSLGAGLSGIIAQRLLRLLCAECKIAAPSGLDAMPETTTYVARGCEACNGTGYVGRKGVFELLEVDDDVREAVASDASGGMLSRAAAVAGYSGMRAHALGMVRDGETSLAEVTRVLGGSNDE